MSTNQGEEPPANIRPPNDSIFSEVIQSILGNEPPAVTTPVLATPVNARSTRELVAPIPRVRRRRIDGTRGVETTRSRRTVVRRATRTPNTRVEKRHDNTETAIEVDPLERDFQDRLDILLQTPNTIPKSTVIPTNVTMKSIVREMNRVESVENAKIALIENDNIENCLNELENELKILEDEEKLIDGLMEEMRKNIEEDRKISLKLELIKDILTNDFV